MKGFSIVHTIFHALLEFETDQNGRVPKLDRIKTRLIAVFTN